MTTLFVGNLSSEVTDSDLRAVFEEYGRVTSVRLMSRRGLAYIEIDPGAAKAAVEGLQGTQLKGRTVDIAVDRGAGGGRPRGRRGGRR
ncbi:MAG: RNA-binding protein [Dehalococcoidia bacterium]